MPFSKHVNRSLTNQNLGFFHKLVRRNLKVKRSWSFSNPSTNIIMTTVAWAKPSIIISRTTNWYTTKMGTNSKNDKPLWFQSTIFICLLITQVCHGNSTLATNFLLCTVTDENWLSTPFDSYSFTHVNLTNVEFSRCKSEDISGCTHGGNEFHNQHAGSGCIGETH